MKASQLGLAQVQAKQQRRQELLLAQAAGIKPRKPSFIERWVFGIRK